MQHKYGEFSKNQISLTKQRLRREVFFLLLCVDPKTKDEYQDVDVNAAIRGLLYKLGGLNSVLFEPPALVLAISLLEEAMSQYNKTNFDFMAYRKLILDAGAQILKIEEE